VVANAGTVKAELPRLARDARVTLTEDRVVQARAAAVVKDIDRRVAGMQAAGQLRGLNREYRAAQEDAVKRGVPIQSYGDHLERYKIRMLYELAEAMRQR
jgi:hypothetical protein